MPHQPLLGLDSTPELKAVCAIHHPSPTRWIENLSNDYYKTLRITAWCLHYLSNFKQLKWKRPLNLNKYLTTAEITAAERFLFKESQSLFFPKELYQLTHNQTVSSSSPLIHLTPFLDKHGLICVGGRLSHSHLHQCHIHPVILHGKSILCHKFLTHKHESLGHCGPSLILSAAGTQVHIIGARRLARTIYCSCVVCRRATPRTQQQLMGQLPTSRLTPILPFTTCGVDYAGPFLLKKGHTRKPVIVKCYMAVFVCFFYKGYPPRSSL